VIARALRTSCGLLFAAVLIVPAVANAASPPHVTEDTQTAGSCAICHRAHTANTELGYRIPTSPDMTGNALIIAPPPGVVTPGFPAPQRGDVGLCYTCHGAPGLGSQFDVESSFAQESSHSLSPQTSAYGPSPKLCGSCHDPHGADRVTPGGAPYPKLLRAWAAPSTPVFSREEYCTSCHVVRSASTFDGLAVYRATGHYSGLPDPANGTRIRCSNCHVAHGSAIAPLIVSAVTTPAAPAAAVVVANDRRLCVACHPDPTATWSGETSYALSAHSVSAVTVPVTGEWARAGAVRRVGECQVCHAPMGRDAGAGVPTPKLLEKAGRALCDTCHAHAPAPAVTDLKSLAYPAVEATAAELVVSWGPDSRSAFAGRTDVYSRATSGGATRSLIGPRAYAAPGASGPAAVGDTDSDGKPEIVRADAGAKTLTILHGDPLRGLQAAAAATVDGAPDFVAVGRFVDPIVDFTGRPQIAVVEAATGKLWLYENMVGDALALVPGPEVDGSYALGGTGTGLAAGEFRGTSLQDLAVTTQGVADQLLLFTQDTVAVSRLGTPAVVPVPTPRGPSVGDLVGSAVAEIAVCSGNGNVYVFDGAGLPVLPFPKPVLAGLPWDSAIGDVLPGSAGNEIAVAARDATDARLDVFFSAGASIPYTRAGVALSGSVLIADVEGDGIDETVLGNAGEWAGVAGMVAPSVDVFRPDSPGAALVHDATLPSGTAALAGLAPSLLAADFGPVVPSRHPIDEVAASHVSTETGSFDRHVTCGDCHDAHEATGTVTTAAPAVTGTMRGAWGSAVTNTGAGAQTLAGSARAGNQYEVCFKCHATSAGGRTNIASAVNAENDSVHAVEASATAVGALLGSFRPGSGWSADSILYCTDCHGSSTAGVKGPHRSAAAPLLKAPFTATSASSDALLCYGCHRKTTYYDGYPAGTDGLALSSSLFFDWNNHSADPVRGALHSYHVRSGSGGLALSCDACHVSHGSATRTHLMRGDIGWTDTGGGGSCDGCHTENRSYTYSIP
jgi:predicted CXXCH cytochrome family protein